MLAACLGRRAALWAAAECAPPRQGCQGGTAAGRGVSRRPESLPARPPMEDLLPARAPHCVPEKVAVEL